MLNTNVKYFGALKTALFLMILSMLFSFTSMLAEAAYEFSLSDTEVAITENFNMSWSTDTDATSYNIRLNNIVSSMGSAVSWTGTPSSLGLSVGTHSVYFQGCNSDGCDDWSKPITLVVLSESAPTSAWLSLDSVYVLPGNDFTASWSGNSNATAYNLKIDNTVHSMGPATSWTGSPNSLGLASGAHTIYAQACNNNGCGSWSPPIVLTVADSDSSIITQSATVAPTLASVEVGLNSVAPNGNLTISWSGNNNSTNYNLKIDGINYPMGPATSWTNTPNSLGLVLGSHNVSVQACNAIGCSPWSDTDTFVVESSTTVAPSEASLFISQSSGATSVLDSFSMSWSGDNLATSYSIKVGNDVYNMGSASSWSGLPATFGLKYSGTYYIKVQACNAGGCSPWSAPKTLVLTSSKISPTSASVSISKTSIPEDEEFSLNWSGDNGPTSFNILFDSNSYDAGEAWSGTSWTGTPKSLGLAPGAHKLYVQACNAGGCSPWSPQPVDFTVTEESLAAPTSISVSIDSVDVSATDVFTISWTSNNDPTFYNMKVGDNQFSVFDTSWTGTPTSLGLSAGSYQLSVQACNSVGCSPWSDTVNFSTTGDVSGTAPTFSSIDYSLPTAEKLTPNVSFCVVWNSNNSPTHYNLNVNQTTYTFGSETSWCGTPADLGLADGKHDLEVQACNVAGCSPWSRTVDLIVNKNDGAPTTATIGVNKNSFEESDTVIVTWSGNNSPVRYNVMIDDIVYDVSSFSEWKGTPDAIGLTPGIHKLYAQACNASGCSPWSTPVTVSYTSTGANATSTTDLTNLPSIAFIVNTTNVKFNSAAVLNWSTTNVTSCTASGDWDGSKGLSGVESTANLIEAATFIITCTGPGGSVTRNLSVAVDGIEPALLSLGADSTIVLAGKSANLTWSAANVTSCTASGDWSGDKAVGVSNTESTGKINKGSKTYVMTCTGPSGTVSDSVTVNVSTTGYIPYLLVCPTPVNVVAGGSLQLQARYWDKLLTAPDCDTPGYTDVTNLANWECPDANIAAITNGGGSKGLLTGANRGGEFPAEVNYGGLVSYTPVTVKGTGGGDDDDGTPPTPTITIKNNPDVVRSGERSDVEVKIFSAYDIRCEMIGADPASGNITFSQSASPVVQTYNYTTLPLTATQMVDMICVAEDNPNIRADAWERVKVIPSTIEEI